MKNISRMFQKTALSVFLVMVVCLPVFSAGSEAPYCIDTPTSGMLDYSAYDLDFRLFSGGGILTRLNFGVFKIVNLGLGWELAEVIGLQSITVAPPTLAVKIKPFSGGLVLPSIAFGYDGQGYFYNKTTNDFAQKERGVFLLFGREFFFSGLEMNFGANMNDFKSNKVYGFTSMNISLDEKIYFLAEYDNINYLPASRFNTGIKFFITSDLSIAIEGRDIGAADRQAERIVSINYRGRF
jgi:hypothetical protein